MPNIKSFTAKSGINTEETNDYIINRSKGIREKKALDITQRLETQPFMGVNPQSLWAISPIFNSLRQELSKRISIDGESVLALKINNSGKDTLILGRATSYKSIDGNLVDIRFMTEYTYVESDSEYKINYHYFFNQGVVTIDKYIEVPFSYNTKLPPKEVKLSTETFANKTTLPVHLFINNYEHKSDSQIADVENQMDLLDQLSNEQFGEYNVSKAMLALNTAISGSESGAEILAKLRQGESVLESQAFGGKLGVAQQMTPAGNSLAVVHMAMTAIEVDIYQRLNLEIPNLLGKKANKHGLEVVMDEKNILRELFAKKLLREEQWNIFFNNIKSWMTLPSELTAFITLQFDDITTALLKVLANETILPPAMNIREQE